MMLAALPSRRAAATVRDVGPSIESRRGRSDEVARYRIGLVDCFNGP